MVYSSLPQLRKGSPLSTLGRVVAGLRRFRPEEGSSFQKASQGPQRSGLRPDVAQQRQTLAH